MSHRFAPRAASSAVIIAVLLTSCGNEAQVHNTITQRQAADRADKYVHDAVAALPNPVQLEPLSIQQDLACDDPTDNGPKGRVIATYDYWLNGIADDRQAGVVDALVQWWQDHGFALLRDRRPQGELNIYVENKTDGFRMGVQQTLSDPKRLSLGASSPCVWPNGTPAPKANPVSQGTNNTTSTADPAGSSQTAALEQRNAATLRRPRRPRPADDDDGPRETFLKTDW